MNPLAWLEQYLKGVPLDPRAMAEGMGTAPSEGAARFGSNLLPLVGDASGALQDAEMFYRDPSSRTWRNGLLSAAGILPGVPGMTSIKKALDWAPGGGSKVAKIGDTEITYGVGKNGIVDLILIKTPKSKRGQGSGRAALQEFVSQAKANGYRVALDADPMDKGISKARLEGFYRSEGFSKNAGKKRDFSTMRSWITEE